MTSNTINIIVCGGVVEDILDIPDEWSYRIIDWDTLNRSESAHRRLLAAFITDGEGSALEREVCAYILDDYENDEEIETFFSDLAAYGCISGLVSSLAYYADTHAFFDRHYEEIEDLRLEIEEMFGRPLQFKGELKNTLAWFAFEETALRIARERLRIAI